MATTHDYMDYLNDRVDIAPAGTEEELQAAEILESLFAQHGLEAQLQYFSTSVFAGLSDKLYQLLMFVGMLLAGFADMQVLSLVGVLLVAIGMVLLLLARRGRDPLLRIGPRTSSQNVIGIHRATGPNVVKGNRPIVIVAHYDTPPENFLYASGMERWMRLIKRLAWPLSIVVAVCAAVQLLVFLPLMTRNAFWAIGVLAALPLVIQCMSVIYERFSMSTPGAVDNKSSIAAMLGVLDTVRPMDDTAKSWAAGHPSPERTGRIVEQADEADGTAAEDTPPMGPATDDDIAAEAWGETGEPKGPFGRLRSFASSLGSYTSHMLGHKELEYSEDSGYDEYEGSVGEPTPRSAVVEEKLVIEELETSRHGEDKLRALQILPDDCDIVYVGIEGRASAETRIAEVRAALEALEAARLAAAAEQVAEDAATPDAATADEVYSDVVSTEDLPEPGAVRNGFDSVEERLQVFFTHLLDLLAGLVARVGAAIRGLVAMVTKSDLPIIDKADVSAADGESGDESDSLDLVDRVPDELIPVEQIFPQGTDESDPLPVAWNADETIGAAPAPVPVPMPVSAPAPAEDGETAVTVATGGRAGRQGTASHPSIIIETEKEDAEEPSLSDAARAVEAILAEEAVQEAANRASVQATPAAEDNVPAEVESPAASVPEPEPPIAPEPETAPVVAPVQTPLTTTEVASLVEGEPEPEPQPEPVVEAKSDIVFETEAADELAPGAELEEEPEPAVEFVSAEEPVVESEDAPETAGEPEAQTPEEPEPAPEAVPESQPVADGESEMVAEPEHEWEAALHPEADVEAGQDADAEADTEADDTVDQGPESESAPSSEAELEPAQASEPDDEPAPARHAHQRNPQPIEPADGVEGVPVEVVDVNSLLITDIYQPRHSAGVYRTAGSAPLDEPEDLFEGDAAAAPASGLWVLDEQQDETQPAEDSAPAPLRQALDEVRAGMERVTDAAYPYDVRTEVVTPQPSAAAVAGAPVEDEPEDEPTPASKHAARMARLTHSSDPLPVRNRPSSASNAGAQQAEVEGASLENPEPQGPENAHEGQSTDQAFELEQAQKATEPESDGAVVQDEAPTQERRGFVGALSRLFGSGKKTDARGQDKMAKLLVPEDAGQSESGAPSEAAPAHEPSEVPYDKVLAQAVHDQEEPPKPETHSYDVLAEAARSAVANVPQDGPAQDDEDEPISYDHGYSPDIMPGLTFSAEMDAREDWNQLDDAGMLTIPREALADAESVLSPFDDRVPAPRAMDEPGWGMSDYRPVPGGFARRARLFDLPDPAVGESSDPLLWYGAGMGNGSGFGSTRNGREAGDNMRYRSPLDDFAPTDPIAEPERRAGSAAARQSDREWLRNNLPNISSRPTHTPAPSMSNSQRRELLAHVPSPLEEPEVPQGYQVQFPTEDFGPELAQRMTADTGRVRGGRAGAPMVDLQPIEPIRPVPPMVEYDDAPRKRRQGQEEKQKRRRFGFGRSSREEQAGNNDSLSEWLGLDDDYDARTSGRRIGDWEHFDDGNWKGGSTQRAGLREQADGETEDVAEIDATRKQPALQTSEEAEVKPAIDTEGQTAADEAPVEEAAEVNEDQKEDAAASDEVGLGDDELISHDIWFVATGASTRDHAGVRAFLNEHRRDIRGAFFVNLDSVGAGQLSVLTQEGTGQRRRADRRMVRLLDSIAGAQDTQLEHVSMPWQTTEGTPAMQRFMRVATLMGLGPEGTPAYSHAADDTIDAVNDAQVASVASMLADLIRKA